MAPNQVNPPKFVSVRWATLPLALAILVAMAARSEASILQGNAFANAYDVSADETLAMLGQDQGAGSSSSSQESSRSEGTTPQDGENDNDSDNAPLHAISPNSPIHEGSSSSSSGVSPGGAMSCTLTSVVVVNNDDTSSRLAIGQSISLSTPPGAELLRPPQS